MGRGEFLSSLVLSQLGTSQKSKESPVSRTLLRYFSLQRRFSPISGVAVAVHQAVRQSIQSLVFDLTDSLAGQSQALTDLLQRFRVGEYYF